MYVRFNNGDLSNLIARSIENLLRILSSYTIKNSLDAVGLSGSHV
jgi:hypothetical protein